MMNQPSIPTTPSSHVPIAIIGGGIAGITAAVRLCEMGIRSLLLEKKPQLGGRARSIFIPRIDAWVDNGQHALGGTYAHTLWLLETLGTQNAIHFDEYLKIAFYYRTRPPFVFRTSPAPAPLHFLGPIFRSRAFSSRDKGQFLRQSLRFFLAPGSGNVAHHFPKQNALYRTIIEPLTLAALNTPPHQASARLLRNILREGFLTTRRGARLGIPKRMLHHVLGAPALKWLQDHGAEVRLKTIVAHITRVRERFHITLKNGERLTADGVILAIPPWELKPLLARSDLSLPSPTETFLRQMTTSAILTANIWFRDPLPLPDVVAFPDGPFQWLFPLPVESRPGSAGYALVMSAPEKRFLALTPEALQDVVITQLCEQTGISLWNTPPAAFFVMKERNATLLQTPEIHPLRPSMASGVPRLWFAGDWVQTHLPATLEGAVRSALQICDDIPHQL